MEDVCLHNVCWFVAGEARRLPSKPLKGFSQLIPSPTLTAGVCGPYALQIDVGTQSTKVLIYSLDTHTVVGRGQCEYSLTATRPGMAEQDPSIWEDVSALSPPRPTQPNLDQTAMKKSNRNSRVSGGGSLTRPFRDARRFPSTRV